jgi:putative restriction endonuclease
LNEKLPRTESTGRSRNVPWTREHRLIALNLYFKIPFGKLHKTNPVIVAAAARMGRTASSLAMKLSNLASLDPVLRASGRSGLPGATKMDRAYWDEFQTHLEQLGPESEELLQRLFALATSGEVDIENGDFIRVSSAPANPPAGPTEVEAMVRLRRGQRFFRGAVFTAYESACCITGLPEPRLLEAAHIKSWSSAPEHRHDPRNGLCLSKLHHAAFDAGLIALDDSFRLLVSSRLSHQQAQAQAVIEDNFLRYEGKPIRRARQNAEPHLEFVRFHREHSFAA